MPLTGGSAQSQASSIAKGKAMANQTKSGGGRLLNPWRVAGWGLAALLLMLPALAMRFTREVDWSLSDFVVMGVLLGTIGLGIEFLVRQSGSAAYRFGAVAAMLTAFLTIWSNLAVGMIGDEDNPYNLAFFGLLLLVLVGTVVVRFRANGMAAVTAIAAAAQAAVSLGGLGSDPRGALIGLCFAGLWLLAAALFWSARRNAAAAA
jgi:hypothetical protein